jgi:tetratricopeptide (TPR) repeat protein
MAGTRWGLKLAPVLFTAMVGAGIGGCISNSAEPFFSELADRTYRHPHCVPKYPGGISFRFAMAHDVIHERYPRHGKAYYAERNRRARQQLAKEVKAVRSGRPSVKYFELLDDLGVGLEALGQREEAVRVLRQKLRQQLESGLSGRALYTSYANLGTFLIHANAARAIRGDKAARVPLREGLEFIHQAIQVNPEAHFGRETWQAVAIAFLLAAMDKPQLLVDYDMVGTGLDSSLHPSQDNNASSGFRKTGPFRRLYPFDALRLGSSGLATITETEKIRRSITHLEPAQAWCYAVKRLQSRVPFDEPALGIIGMWRLGGGPNPHFALALGDIMVQVGQNYIAWTAYERALRLADRFWPPDPKITEQFVAFCRSQQAAIEQLLPAGERDGLRPRFEAELAYGKRYQTAYQDYEGMQIRAGVPLDDPHFYDAFYAEHGEIASPVGDADQFTVNHNDLLRALPLMMLLAGAFAFFTACIQWLWARARQ